jgi:hypothetical protein
LQTKGYHESWPVFLIANLIATRQELLTPTELVLAMAAGITFRLIFNKWVALMYYRDGKTKMGRLGRPDNHNN